MENQKLQRPANYLSRFLGANQVGAIRRQIEADINDRSVLSARDYFMQGDPSEFLRILSHYADQDGVVPEENKEQAGVVLKELSTYCESNPIDALAQKCEFLEQRLAAVEKQLVAKTRKAAKVSK